MCPALCVVIFCNLSLAHGSENNTWRQSPSLFINKYGNEMHYTPEIWSFIRPWRESQKLKNPKFEPEEHEVMFRHLGLRYSHVLVFFDAFKRSRAMLKCARTIPELFKALEGPLAAIVTTNKTKEFFEIHGKPDIWEEGCELIEQLIDKRTMVLYILREIYMILPIMPLFINAASKNSLSKILETLFMYIFAVTVPDSFSRKKVLEIGSRMFLVFGKAFPTAQAFKGYIRLLFYYMRRQGLNGVDNVQVAGLDAESLRKSFTSIDTNGVSKARVVLEYGLSTIVDESAYMRALRSAINLLKTLQNSTSRLISLGFDGVYEKIHCKDRPYYVPKLFSLPCNYKCTVLNAKDLPKDNCTHKPVGLPIEYLNNFIETSMTCQIYLYDIISELRLFLYTKDWNGKRQVNKICTEKEYVEIFYGAFDKLFSKNSSIWIPEMFATQTKSDLYVWLTMSVLTRNKKNAFGKKISNYLSCEFHKKHGGIFGSIAEPKKLASRFILSELSLSKKPRYVIPKYFKAGGAFPAHFKRFKQKKEDVYLGMSTIDYLSIYGAIPNGLPLGSDLRQYAESVLKIISEGKDESLIRVDNIDDMRMYLLFWYYFGLIEAHMHDTNPRNMIASVMMKNYESEREELFANFEKAIKASIKSVSPPLGFKSWFDVSSAGNANNNRDGPKWLGFSSHLDEDELVGFCNFREYFFC